MLLGQRPPAPCPETRPGPCGIAPAAHRRGAARKIGGGFGIGGSHPPPEGVAGLFRGPDGIVEAARCGLGLDRGGVENYQVTLGGDATETMALGERAGPGFSADELVPALERLVGAYLEAREDENETFLEAYRRLGPEPFRQALYPAREMENVA